ncbi:MAG: hypothetical protein AVDCRST_MAG74-1160 [uncultured Pyrinomonadaceae bacterium]|uniref:Uncharacterized protein n=1 Tax=uncultured Pyrinomonadaceae bacterium TaxID=2283094 RepID=A0A6J4NUH3_9BACT|nr:MAG: hypothetical protein AVDCRST_MAG74-1160 [uncultured Pyrinomonadaceae bacterium]
MSKITFLDSIAVQSPCSKSWNEMRGNEQIRFCSHCAKDVHNLSEMTRKRARKIVAASNGNICVRYTRRPDGRIQAIKNTLHQITRQTGIAAGVLGTSLAASTVAYTQGDLRVSPNENVVAVQVENQKSDAPNGTISGTITDPNGAVIAFALVTLTNEQTAFYQSVNSNQEGVYEFKDVPIGEYKLKVDAGGFASKEIAQVSAGSGEQNYNAQLAIETMHEAVTVGGEGQGEGSGVGYGVGGAMVSIIRYSALVMAVENDDLDEVKMLVAKGARVNAKDKGYDKNTPLHVAVENGNLEIVKFLLSSGAKTSSKNADKRTPLMMLDEDASAEIVNLLLIYGAKINFADREGNTALTFAAEYSSEEVVQALIRAGANVNWLNKKGESALMRAAENGELENVNLLLGAGANAQFRNKEGETALSMTRNEAVKQILISYGATE